MGLHLSGENGLVPLLMGDKWGTPKRALASLQGSWGAAEKDPRATSQTPTPLLCLLRRMLSNIWPEQLSGKRGMQMPSDGFFLKKHFTSEWRHCCWAVCAGDKLIPFINGPVALWCVWDACGVKAPGELGQWWEMWGGMETCGEAWGHVGRHGEEWGHVGVSQHRPLGHTGSFSQGGPCHNKTGW